MLEKSMYDSWSSRIRLFIKGKKNGRMMLDSIDNGPLVCPTVKENRQTRPKKYSENLLKHNNFKMTVMFKKKISFFMVFHSMCMHFTIHHQHHHTIVNPQQQSISPQPFISLSGIQQSQTKFPQLDSGLVVPTFQLGEDLIDCINKAMEFLSALASSFAGTGNRGIATTSRGNYAAGQAKAVKCYNFLGERAYGEIVHSAKEAKKFCMAENLDSYDSDCDDISSTKAVLMANISSCNSDVLSEESQDAGIRDTNSSAPNDLLVLCLVEQITDHVANLDKKNQTNKVVNESLTVELERYKERVAMFEQRRNSQGKDTVIRKLKDMIKSLSGKDSVENVKKDIDEIETINIELKHTMKNELRKLKGKNIINTDVSKPSATIASGMFKLDIERISHRLKNNRDAHEELLVYVSKTCRSLTIPTKKLVVVTPMNKDKKVRFAEPVTSSRNIPK
uniref:Uncharacterized protein n=1 Tax=Tanacetum cinerariifolium TaxID=118510 RepID=A0A6L2NVX5_TANCI|nr:hypothetical protein [Tanacetum cinerariifolium]